MPEQGEKSGDDCVFESVPKDYNRPIAACCEILNTGQRWHTVDIHSTKRRVTRQLRIVHTTT